MNGKYNQYKFSGIYSITNILNKKRYIGSAVNIHRRMLQHRWDLENNKHHSEHLQKSFDKNGIENFKIEILEKFNFNEISDEILFELEEFYIEKYDTTNGLFGYNSTNGGKGTKGRVMSIESRNKISIAHKGKIVSELTRQRISDSGTGRKHSEETKKQMSESRTGIEQWWNIKGELHEVKQSTRDKISKIHKGRKRPEGTGDKISESKTGKKVNKICSSQYVGVSKSKNKWKAYISVNKKRINLKEHNTEIEAALAYNDAAIKYFGVNARINIIKKEE